MYSIEIIRALNKANHKRYLENRRRKTGNILDEVAKKVDQNIRQLENYSSGLLNDLSRISQRFTEELEKVFEIKNTK